jgi:hypothetical protein
METGWTSYADMRATMDNRNVTGFREPIVVSTGLICLSSPGINLGKLTNRVGENLPDYLSYIAEHLED